MTNVYHRTVAIQPGSIRAKERMVSASLSSELPVPRPFGPEVLVHKTGSVDLNRAPLPLLDSHDTQRLPVGVVENIRIAGDKLRGDLRFGQSTRAQEVWVDVQAGVLRSISIGYVIHKAEQRGDTTHVTRWEPHEVSLVAVPADPTVGIGRSFHSGVHTMTDIQVPETETLEAEDRQPPLRDRERCESERVE